MEVQDFKLDASAILKSIIKDQAGSLSKALLEAVMNAVDAGATRCTLKLSESRFTVRDNGKGFRDRDEIDRFFGTFGTPHEAGDAIYGRYRMGRGQIFAFSRNTWRTGTFRMSVDIQGKGLGYALETSLSPVKGCTIEGELYEVMEPWHLNDVVQELRKMLAYCQIPVTLNGVLVSRQPQDLKWDLETPTAYIKLTRAPQLSIYNLGVHVCDYPAYRFGCGGVVVSKTALGVNFARNAILEYSCDVWAAIKQDLRVEASSRVARKSNLTDDERMFLAGQLVADTGLTPERWAQFANANIVLTATGKNATLEQLMQAHTVVMVPDNQRRLGEQIHRSRQAFCLTEESVRRFNCRTLDEFLELLRVQCPSMADEPLWPSPISFEELASTARTGFDQIEAEDHSPEEAAGLKALKAVNSRLFGPWLAKQGTPIAQRELRIGESSAALAWTNGSTTIHLERKFLMKCARAGADGWHRMMMVLLHEYCHGEPDHLSHDHDQNFYELFEELATDRSCPIGRAIELATREYGRPSKASRSPLRRQGTRRLKALETAPPVAMAAKSAPAEEARAQLSLFG